MTPLNSLVRSIGQAAATDLRRLAVYLGSAAFCALLLVALLTEASFAAEPTGDTKQFPQAYNEMKSNLVALLPKIQKAMADIKEATDSGQQKKNIAAMRETIGVLLGKLADNGEVMTQAQSTRTFVREKLAYYESAAHLDPIEKTKIVATLKDQSQQLEVELTDLDAVRMQLLDLLHALQKNEDLIAAWEDVNATANMIKIIHDLTGALRDSVDKIQKVLTHMGPGV